MLEEVVMKTLVIFVFFGVFQVQGAPLTADQKEKLNSYHENCVLQSGVNTGLIQKARKGIYTDDTGFKNYLYCFSQKIGFQDGNGVVQKDVFENKVREVVEDKDVIAKLVEQCTRQKDNPEDTSLNMAKCMREVAPTLELFEVAPGIVYLPNEQTQTHLARHKECAAQDKLGEKAIEDALQKGVLFEDPQFKEYLYCFSKKQGLQNEEGIINKDVFQKCFGKVIKDSKVVDELVEKCAREQSTPEDTAFFMSKCIHENSPVYVELFPREITVPDAIAKDIIEHSKTCLKETGADKELVLKTRKGVFTDDPKLKEFTLCMSKKAGFLNDEGDFQIEIMKQKMLKIHKDPVVIENLVKLCAVKQSSPQESAFLSQQCIHRNAPGHLSITQFGALSETQKEKRTKFIKECSEETKVSKSVVLSARKGDFQDDPLLKQYFFCLNKKTGIVNEDGAYNKEFIRKGLTEIFNEDEAEKIMEKCVKTLDTPINTSFEGMKCWYKYAPEASVVF